MNEWKALNSVTELIGLLNFEANQCITQSKWNVGFWFIRHALKPTLNNLFKHFNRPHVAWILTLLHPKCEYRLSNSIAIYFHFASFILYSHEISNDNQITIGNELNTAGSLNPQLICCVVSNNSADRYATIKKRCYIEIGVPSQVIVHKTIIPKDKNRAVSGLLSVATKVFDYYYSCHEILFYFPITLIVANLIFRWQFKWIVS